MGCVFSKYDRHPSIFQVSNVDERGNKLQSGQLEVTETDLVLYHRGKAPIKWPLRTLRRYGFDSELFSFESGRRCPTGQGVYAFRCHRAEQLFNLLQTHIQMRNNSTDDTVSRDFAPPLPPSARHNGGVGVDGNYLEPTPFCQTGTGLRFPLLNGPARINSIGSSNGPLSPQGTGSPSPPPGIGNNYANEEVFVKTDLDKHRSLSHSYSNTNSLSLSVPLENAPDLVQQTNGLLDRSPSAVVPLSPTESVASASDFNHSRLEDSNSGAFDESVEVISSNPVYMNVVPRQEGVSNERARRSTVRDSTSDEFTHCYENLEPGELERLTRTVTVRADRPMPLTMPMHSTQLASGSMSQPVTPVTPAPVINYIVLDLEQVAPRNEVPPSPLSVTNGSSLTLDLPASKPSERYATIDFNRTEAIELLNSAIPGAEPDTEGSRRTRHNSTIPVDLPPPITSSGSSSSRYSGTPNE